MNIIELEVNIALKVRRTYETILATIGSASVAPVLPRVHTNDRNLFFYAQNRTGMISKFRIYCVGRNFRNRTSQKQLIYRTGIYCWSGCIFRGEKKTQTDIVITRGLDETNERVKISVRRFGSETSSSDRLRSKITIEVQLPPTTRTQSNERRVRARTTDKRKENSRIIFDSFCVFCARCSACVLYAWKCI